MSYDGKLMRRAMVRFEEAKQRRADALHARERAVYAAVPRIAEIDAALRETMSKLISSALRRGTDPRPAIEALKEENLALQRERAELLVAHGYPADYLEDKPNCPLCGDTGWRGSEVCSCLNDYYARVQLEELSRLLDLGTQSFETFSFDVYSPYAPLDQDISPRSNMERIYDACRDYAYEFSPRSGNLLLSGDPGLGKTFLSACIAREVAAILGKPLHMPAMDYNTVCDADEPISVKVEAPDLCPRYMAHYVRNIRMSESPRWIKRHLALCGLRSISNVVDITNHTLLEMGQPMHAFDLNKVAGRSITVRRAVEGEKITTLDEKEFTLNPNNLVICDAEKPVALAGIMGGANSGMDDNTTSLLFECATFARDSVRKTSRALGQNSDSSARYEKGVDRHSPELGLARALHLIQELDCGDITTLEYDLTDGRPLERKHIVTTPAKICGVLGITVPDQTMIDILKRLEFTVDVQADGSWDVSAPLYREDVESFPDLAEEVIREYGYDHIVPTFLNTAAVTNGGLNYEQKQQLKTKRLLAAQGFYEASTLAFYSNAEFDMLHIPAEDEARKAIRILNPISENLSVMRTLLAPSMLNVIVDNLKKGNAEGRLFEMAPVYLAKELPINEHPHERQTLCIGAFGPEEDFFTVKGALEGLAEGFDLTFTYQRETTSWLHPGISAAVYCNGKRLGVFGKLANEINAELEIAKEQKDSQNIYLGELDYEALMSCVEGELRYKPLSPYAAVKRDLALVCDEAVACGDIEETIRKASPLITEVKLFDIYRGANLGEGKKSMAFSLTLSDPAAEVSNEQVERTVKKVLGNLKFKLGIEIR